MDVTDLNSYPEQSGYINKTIEVKPCPFCGGKPFMDSSHWSSSKTKFFFRISCLKCESDGPLKEKLAEAVRSWNRGGKQKAKFITLRVRVSMEYIEK